MGIWSLILCIPRAILLEHRIPPSGNSNVALRLRFNDTFSPSGFRLEEWKEELGKIIGYACARSR